MSGPLLQRLSRVTPQEKQSLLIKCFFVTYFLLCTYVMLVSICSSIYVDRTAESTPVSAINKVDSVAEAGSVTKITYTVDVHDITRVTDTLHMLDGNAWKPLVYRTLVPQITNFIVYISPQSIKDKVNNHFKNVHYNPVLQKLVASYLVHFQHNDDAYRFLVVFFVMYLFLMAYAVSMYVLGKTLFPENLSVALIAPALGIIILPAFNYAFPRLKVYDYAQLMFTTLCLYSMFAGRFRMYSILFALSCVNKETTFFLMIFFAVWFYGRMEQKLYSKLVMRQLSISIYIKLIINAYFAQNLQPDWFLQESQLYAFYTGYSLQIVFNLLFLYMLMTYKFTEKPLFLRYSLILFALQYPAYFFFCHAEEYRNFFEVLPTLTLIGTHSLVRYSGLDQIRWFQKIDGQQTANSSFSHPPG